MDVRMPDGTVITNVPEGTTQEDLTAQYNAHKMNSGAQKPTTLSGRMVENRARNSALMQGGWGTGYGPAMYELGGKVTDLTGSPVAGGITNFLGNAIPEFLSAGKVVGSPSSLAEGFGTWLMQKAVRPGKAARESGDAARAMQTMLDEVIYPTTSGMDKAGKIAAKLDKLVDAPISKSTANVPVSEITAPIADVMKKAERQLVPQSDVAAVEDVWTKFLQNPLISGLKEIPVQLAHELKKGTYKSLGGKAYGEVGSSSIEAQKALARGAREGVAKAVPEVQEPLARQASMMNVMDVAGDRALLEGNKNLLSLAPIASHPIAAMGFLADRWAALKAFAALQAYHGAKPQVITPFALAGQQTNAQMREDLGALYSEIRRKLAEQGQ